MQPISGVSKERVTLWSDCIGLTVLAGFLGQRPKWDGATPSPSGEPTTLERSGEVIVGYTGASTVAHATTTEYRLKSGVLRLSIPLPYVRDSYTVNRAVLYLFGAFFTALVKCYSSAIYDTGIPGSACVRQVGFLPVG